MSDSNDGSRLSRDRNPLAPAKTGIAMMLKVVVILLAIIGGITVITGFSMGWMHFSMMRGMGG